MTTGFEIGIYENSSHQLATSTFYAKKKDTEMKKEIYQGVLMFKERKEGGYLQILSRRCMCSDAPRENKRAMPWQERKGSDSSENLI